MTLPTGSHDKFPLQLPSASHTRGVLEELIYPVLQLTFTTVPKVVTLSFKIPFVTDNSPQSKQYVKLDN
jgi:hypothetical protein